MNEAGIFDQRMAELQLNSLSSDEFRLLRSFLYGTTIDFNSDNALKTLVLANKVC